jgi:hypothetical protein
VLRTLTDWLTRRFPGHEGRDWPRILTEAASRLTTDNLRNVYAAPTTTDVARDVIYAELKRRNSQP